MHHAASLANTSATDTREVVELLLEMRRDATDTPALKDTRWSAGENVSAAGVAATLAMSCRAGGTSVSCMVLEVPPPPLLLHLVWCGGKTES